MEDGTGTKLSFDPADLPCGPAGETVPFNNGFAEDSVTSYRPVIAMPSKLVELVPEWADCGAYFYAGLDPPRLLTPVPQFMPSTTSVDPTPLTNAAAPIQTIQAPPSSTSPLPPGTTSASPGVSNLNQPSASQTDASSRRKNSGQGASSVIASDSAVLASIDPAVSPTAAVDQNTDSASGTVLVVPGGQSALGDPNISTDSSQGPMLPAPFASIVDPPQRTASPKAGDPSLNSGFAQTEARLPSDSKSDALSTPKAPLATIAGQGNTMTSDAASVAPIITAILYSSGSLYVGSNVPSPSTQSISPLVIGSFSLAPIASAVQPSNGPQMSAIPIAIGGQTASLVNPSVVVMASQSVVLGQAPVTVSGKPVSLGGGGLVLGGSRTVPLPSATPSPITAGEGPTDSIRSSSVVITDGIGVTPGGEVWTNAGTTFSLDRSSDLVVGPSTFRLVPSHTSPASDSELALANSQVTPMGATTLTPGSPALTVDGTIISLGSSVLISGTHTIVLASAASLVTSDSRTPTGGIGGIIMSALGEVTSAGFISSVISKHTARVSTTSQHTVIFSSTYLPLGVSPSSNLSSASSASSPESQPLYHTSVGLPSIVTGVPNATSASVGFTLPSTTEVNAHTGTLSPPLASPSSSGQPHSGGGRSAGGLATWKVLVVEILAVYIGSM